MLEEENAILKLKGRKVGELEEKVEMVLKQNAQLLTENEKMSRFLHQQKSENEVLRNKVETLSNQRASLMGEFEL
jgi:regulator of replication initiation timing